MSSLLTPRQAAASLEMTHARINSPADYATGLSQVKVGGQQFWGSRSLWVLLKKKSKGSKLAGDAGICSSATPGEQKELIHRRVFPPTEATLSQNAQNVGSS